MSEAALYQNIFSNPQQFYLTGPQALALVLQALTDLRASQTFYRICLPVTVSLAVWTILLKYLLK